MLTKKLQDKQARWLSKGKRRSRLFLDARLEDNRILIDDQLGVNFSSNDYLGLHQHSAIAKAFKQGIDRFGFGAGASAAVSGAFKIQKSLEEKFASYVGAERSLLFNSGYHANLGVISALTNKADEIYLDEQSHASVSEGVFASRANYTRYRHADIEHLFSLLQHKTADLILAEGVSSVKGTIAPIQSLAKVAKLFNVPFVLDDAHGVGVLGKSGRGILDHFNLPFSERVCLVTPLGKAFHGMGAMVSGSEVLIEAIMQFSKTYRYTTALPPAVVAALSATLEVVQQDAWRRERLFERIHFFNRLSKQFDLPLLSNELTPIRALLVGDNYIAEKMQRELWRRGVLVACLRPPSVKPSEACLRFSLNCWHSEADIQNCLENLSEVYHAYLCDRHRYRCG